MNYTFPRGPAATLPSSSHPEPLIYWFLALMNENDLLRFVRIHLAAGSRMTDRGLVARTVAPHEVARMGIAWRGFRIVDQDGIGAALLVFKRLRRGAAADTSLILLHVYGGSLDLGGLEWSHRSPPSSARSADVTH